MSQVGQFEKQTQARVVALFRDRLGCDYLGKWIDRAGNADIEPELLAAWLGKQGVDDSLIGKALYELEKAANDASKHLYDRNRAVCELLRYGVKVQRGAGENKVTVWPIDWKRPENNDFAVAEEVTVKGATPRRAPSARMWCYTSTAPPSVCRS